MKHLCLIINRYTHETLAEYTVETIDWYFARNIAANMFQDEKRDLLGSDWCVDSMEV